MSNKALGVVAVIVLAAAGGCASSNRIAANKLTQTGSWYGELGIAGYLNDITVDSRSRLTKLSILGDANKVTVEDGATLGKVEIWGDDNTISIPEHLVIRVNEVGDGNKIVRRPAAPRKLAAEPLPMPAAPVVQRPVEPAPPPEPVEGAPSPEPTTRPAGGPVEDVEPTSEPNAPQK